MKALVQWTGRDPDDYLELDFARDPLSWEELAKRDVPVPGQIGGLDNLPGYIMGVNVKGLTLNGADHYALRPVTVAGESGLELTSWWDDPDDAPIGERRARVWTVLDLAPDPNLGGAINTRQSQVVYAEGQRYMSLLARPPQNTIVLPWADFDAPNILARHGIWVPDSLHAQHVAARTLWGWRHWVDHLDDNEVEYEAGYVHNGQLAMLPTPRRMLRVQRDMGRWSKAQGTITYYQRDANRAQGWEAATHEDALELTTAAAVTESVTTDAAAVLCWLFETPANEPNSVDWPSGNYRFQFDCTAASNGLVYAVKGVTNNSGFYQLTSAEGIITAWPQVEADFSGTGLKLATTGTINPAAGASGDLFAMRVTADGDSHNDAITLELNTADSYADGPWVSGPNTEGGEYPYVEQPVLRTLRVLAY